jgi:hypothetical protein
MRQRALTDVIVVTIVALVVGLAVALGALTIIAVMTV